MVKRNTNKSLLWGPTYPGNYKISEYSPAFSICDSDFYNKIVFSGTTFYRYKFALTKNEEPVKEKLNVVGTLRSFNIQNRLVTHPGWIYSATREYKVTFTIDDDVYIFTSELPPFKHYNDGQDIRYCITRNVEEYELDD